MSPLNRRWLALAALFLFLAAPRAARSQEKPEESAQSARPVAASAGKDDLASGQRQLAQRFAKLENLLLKMADLTASTDPRRASLLRRAAAQSKDRDLVGQYEKLVALLTQDRLAAGVKSQAAIDHELNQLLDLLLSEERNKRLESEKEKIRQYLKRVNSLIKEQKGILGETTQQDPQKMAGPQSDLADKTGKLTEDVRQTQGSPANESAPPKQQGEGTDRQKPDGDQPPDSKKPADEGPAREPAKDGEGKEKQPPEGKPADGKVPDEKNPSGKPPEGESQEKENSGDTAKEKKPADATEPKPGSKSNPSDAKPGDQQSGKPQDGKPEEGKKGSPPMPGGEPGESSQDQQSTDASTPQENPLQQRLREAEQRMRDAQKKLNESKKNDAQDQQQQAIEQLEAAKAELEKILRQLREEEMARTLTLLEGRFRKMLALQVEVYDGTRRLDGVPEAQRDRDDEIEAGRLSRKEAEIVSEADRALALLAEEASAVAFPEAIRDMRDEMEQVVVQLAQAKVGSLVQGTEKEIIAALEEMLSSLKQAQKDLEKQKQRKQQGQPGQPGEPPLVEKLAEIKMIRALQLRVNDRTEQFKKMAEADTTLQPDVLKAVQRLAERQERIRRVTRDIVAGRNE